MSIIERELTCITCPRGCHLTVTVKDGKVLSVKGNSCPRGAVYGESEVIHPVRTLTSTMSVENRPGVMISVKTDRPIPKEKMLTVAAQINQRKAIAPIAIGDILIANICGDSNIVATGNLK